MQVKEQYWVLGDRYTFHVCLPELAVIEIQSEFQHGPPPHSHTVEEETLYILEGTLQVLCDGAMHVLQKGDFFHFPKGIVHGFETVSLNGSRILVTICLGALVDLFRRVGATVEDNGQAASVSPPAKQRLQELARAYGLELSVPPPH